MATPSPSAPAPPPAAPGRAMSGQRRHRLQRDDTATSAPTVGSPSAAPMVATATPRPAAPAGSSATAATPRRDRGRGRGASQRRGDRGRRHQLRQQPRQHILVGVGGLFGRASNVHINGGTCATAPPSPSAPTAARPSPVPTGAMATPRPVAPAARTATVATRRPATAGSRWPVPTAAR